MCCPLQYSTDLPQLVAEDYVGLMVTDAIGTGHSERKVNISCAESGDLYASICDGSQCALNSIIPADQCATSSYSATQTGCAVPIRKTLISSNNVDIS